MELLRLAIDFAPSGLLAVDATGRIVLANRAIEGLFGRSWSELTGQPADVLLAPSSRALRPFDPEAAAARQGAHGEHPLECTGLRQDGAEVPLEVDVNVVWTTDGVLTFASIVDISARKQAEERFRIAVEAAPSGMVMVDQRGAIVLVNRETERLLGYSRDELIGQSVETLVPERFSGTHPAQRAGFHAQPSARPMGHPDELFARHKDGTEIPVEIGLNPIRTGEGLLVLCSIVDIRARRTLEQQFRQAQKMEAIGTLAGGIAHDFNNILRAILGFTELASSAAGDNPRVQADLGQVLKATERGRTLVERILAFSRQRDASHGTLRLDRAIGEALDFLRASLPSSIQIRRSFDPHTPPVVGDETELHQVVLNLATNAAQAMEGDGILEVSLGPIVVDEEGPRAHATLRPGIYARLRVQDTGHGMPPEVVARAFDPFFTTKPPGSGTGLGLSMVHGIVTRHGGVIDVDSRPGEGTRIDVYVPAAPSADAQTEEGVATTPAAAHVPHILLVEDEEMLAELGRRQLEGLGYRVTAHTSSLGALDAFRANPQAFDAVVTDNTMPRLTGFALAKEMIRIRPEVPILMVSGLAEGLDPEHVYAAGVRMVLRKPHTRAQLADAVRTLIGEATGESGR
jgi:PAS domain S-box-containing protein